MVQNLLDAGCDAEKISVICGLYDEGRMQDAVRVLRRHRCGLMDHLHQSQSRVDCLDYLVYKMEKEMPGGIPLCPKSMDKTKEMKTKKKGKNFDGEFKTGNGMG